MTKDKIAYTERVIDGHGVERLYGVSQDGKIYLLNIKEVMEAYESKGLGHLWRRVA